MRITIESSNTREKLTQNLKEIESLIERTILIKENNRALFIKPNSIENIEDCISMLCSARTYLKILIKKLPESL
jgi:hypothetical protein